MSSSEVVIKKMNIPITVCHVNCPSCKMPVDFSVFESGLGGDYKTLYGITTNQYYRVDLAGLYYSKKSVNDVLHEITKIEGAKENVVEYPEKLKCKFCKTTFSNNDNIMIDKEIIINAFVI